MDIVYQLGSVTIMFALEHSDEADNDKSIFFKCGSLKDIWAVKILA